MRTAFASLALAAGIGLSAGCSSDQTNDDGAGGGSSTSSQTGAGGSGGAGTVEPLTDHERYLLGVWRGTISVEDQEFTYFVLNDDRTGCAWDRHGENFGQRWFEWSFTNWRLEETPLDADGRMTIRLLSSDGTEQAIERYDPESDNIFIAGIQSTTWQDFLIPCSAAGSNTTVTGVMRQGLAP